MRVVYLSILLAPVLMVSACENGPPWAGESEPTAEEAAPDFGPTAAYNRRLLFLGPGNDLPTTAIFDFTVLSDSVGIRRGVRARVLDDAGWHTLMDAGWEMEPMREPWRLVPHGPLTMVVSDAGDLAALIHRDSLTTRLQIGPTLAEHSPDVSTQLVLRGARLALDGEAVSGVLLDAQLGRSVNPALVTRSAAVVARRPTRPADSAMATPPATPIARAGAEALLLDDEGYYAVFAAAASGDLAWVRSAGRDDVWEGARLEPTASSRDAADARPTAWRIVSPAGELTGELVARSADRILLEEPGDLQTLAYVLVSGWVEDRAVRREVFGLLRDVQ